MLVAFLFCHHDRELAFKNLAWMVEMEMGSGHEILVVAPSGVSKPDAAKSLALAEKGFDKATLYHLDDDCTTGWPFGPNFMFRRTVDYITHFKLWPFLLLESDAWLLKRNSLDLIESEYRASGQPFMGYLESEGKTGQHMNGVGVYGDIATFAPMLLSAPWPQDPSQIGANHMAFDMAGAEQVTERMKNSRLFQFQYKQEDRLLEDETLSFLNPDAAVFHTEKTGRLVELLRLNSNPLKPNAFTPSWLHEQRVIESLASASIPQQPTGLTTSIFIKTYPADRMWHEQCLKSIAKFCAGFEEVRVTEDEKGNGYLNQQVVKLNTDKYCRGDFILITDSDTLFTIPITPDTFMDNGKPMWFYALKENVLKADKGTQKWFDCMERFLGAKPHHEFMRRQPFFVPRWLFQAFRQFCWQRHGKSVEDYVMAQEEFSEWNCLGFYAWTFHREAFAWIGDDAAFCPPLVCRQFWSAHHFTPERREAQFQEALPEINRILGVEEKKPELAVIHPAAAPIVANDGWGKIEGEPSAKMDLAAQAITNATAEEAKKQAMRERMAKARAGRGKKKVAA